MSLDKMELVYWMEDESWYNIISEDKIQLTDKAPDRARKSFEAWCKYNGFNM